MEARELRIGNYVQRYGEIITVDGIDDIDVFNKNCGEIPLHSVEPIQLTEDWMLKFGCQRVESGWLVKYCDFLFYDPLFKNGGGQYESRKIVKGGFMRKSHFVSDLAIRYVHQLQNLYFALTGEELKII